MVGKIFFESLHLQFVHQLHPCRHINLAPLPKGAGLRQGSLLSNLVISGDTCDIQIALTLSAAKTEGSLAKNCFSPAVASVNNPSVTVTENTILCQRIFNFYKKQY